MICIKLFAYSFTHNFKINLTIRTSQAALNRNYQSKKLSLKRTLKCSAHEKPLTSHYWKNRFWAIFTSEPQAIPFLWTLYQNTKWKLMREKKSWKAKRQLKWAHSENNSPYLKSVHKCWITEEMSLLFYSINFKWLLASRAFFCFSQYETHP